MQNRAAVMQGIAGALASAAGDGGATAVLALRLRRWREVNLLFGYEVGERLVEDIKAGIDAAIRPNDEIWRTGDDGFILLLPGLRDRNHAALAAAKLVRVLHEPLSIQGNQVLPLVSVGIATSPADASDPELLCRYADQACEAAAGTGDRFAFHEQPRIAGAFPYGDLRLAIERNQLQVHLQGITHLRTGRVVGFEALARWRHPTLGDIPPDVFIEVAEQTGLIHELTRWNLNVVLRHLAAARDAFGEHDAPSISVNIAVDALQKPGFVEQVQDLLKLWGVPPRQLRFEITESGLMTDLQHCEQLLGAFRALGIGIGIDDFGTGYSSMAYLRRLPADSLKIDQSFVRDMRDDLRAQKLVASMIDVSHHVGMSVVAEGVEDETTMLLLAGMGCDHGQGYHFSRPEPAEDALSRLIAAKGAWKRG